MWGAAGSHPAGAGAAAFPAADAAMFTGTPWPKSRNVHAGGKPCAQVQNQNPDVHTAWGNSLPYGNLRNTRGWQSSAFPSAWKLRGYQACHCRPLDPARSLVLVVLGVLGALYGYGLDFFFFFFFKKTLL